MAVPALVLVLLRRGQLPRLLALFYLAGAAALGYAVTLGTLEENELYLLFVPSLLILPVAAALWLRGPRGAGTRRGRAKAWAGGCTAAVAVLACVNLSTCVVWLIQPDNGFQRLRQYMAAHIPAGTTVASVDDSPPLTAGTTFWALSDHYTRRPVGQRRRTAPGTTSGTWSSPGLEIGQGYSYLTDGAGAQPGPGRPPAVLVPRAHLRRPRAVPDPAARAAAGHGPGARARRHKARRHKALPGSSRGAGEDRAQVAVAQRDGVALHAARPLGLRGDGVGVPRRQAERAEAGDAQQGERLPDPGRRRPR